MKNFYDKTSVLIMNICLGLAMLVKVIMINLRSELFLSWNNTDLFIMMILFIFNMIMYALVRKKELDKNA